MAEPKTQPTGASVSAYIDALADERKRNDCHRLVQMMTRVTGAPPVMWGTSIVGFDAYRYTYANGTAGDWPVIGFAPRARDLTLYLMDGFDNRADALARLGRHTHSKSCLHVKSLADIDLGVLETMLTDSVRVVRARYPTGSAAGSASAAATSAATTRRAATKPTAKSAVAPKASKTAATKAAKKTSKPTATKPAKKITRQASKKASKKAAATPTFATHRATKQAGPTVNSRVRRA
jgi:hypothetical protein